MFLKLMGAMPGYVYAQDKSGIYVNLFVGSTAQVQLAGQKVVLSQATDYPWQGEVKIRVETARAKEFDLHIRAPSWCAGAAAADDLYQFQNRPASGGMHVKVNGKAFQNLNIVRGYANLRRPWKSGDLVQVSFDMPVLRVKANDRVEAAKGRVALVRGPMVYCFEGTDNGTGVQNLVIPSGTEFTPEFRSDLLGGISVLHATATGVFKTAVDQVGSVPFKVTAIPYFANANRGTCPMQVWMAESAEGAKALKQE